MVRLAQVCGFLAAAALFFCISPASFAQDREAFWTGDGGLVFGP
jgi:hypothetical protein